MKVLVSVRFRQWTDMIRFIILHFLLVSCSFNLIEHNHAMKMSFFDFHYENLIKESNPNESKSHLIVDHHEKSWIAKTKKRIVHKLLQQSSRTTPTSPRFDHEMELVNGYKLRTRKAKTTRKPVIIKIVSPKNRDRFDIWGG